LTPPPPHTHAHAHLAGLKAVGFDYVFDTDFAADLTIMEEGTELLHRLKQAWGLEKGEGETGRVLTGSGQARGLAAWTLGLSQA